MQDTCIHRMTHGRHGLGHLEVMCQTRWVLSKVCPSVYWRVFMRVSTHLFSGLRYNSPQGACLLHLVAS
jgi:hypothetical protein